MAEPPVALRYHPSVETPEKDEAETVQALRDTMRKIREKTLDDGGQPLRSVHAKSHGLLKAELEVFGDLHPALAQGMFARPGRYPAVIRLSTLPGDLLDDSVSTPRGMAVKIVGVEGARLEGSEGDVTQDLVMVNGPAFASPNAKAFLANLKLLAATTGRGQGAKKALSAVLRGVEHAVEAFGGKSATVSTLGGQPETHILGDSFYTQVPVRYGDYIAKLAVTPASPELKALTDQRVEVNGRPNGLREAVLDFFATHGASWDLRVQLCTDLDDTPVEDAHKIWPEDKSPYIAVGRLIAPPQVSWSLARSAAVDGAMSFSPWHGIEAHRPLGSIMRSRKAAYVESAAFRTEHGVGPVTEPRALDALPD